jgi:hypothetical protein
LEPISRAHPIAPSRSKPNHLEPLGGPLWAESEHTRVVSGRSGVCAEGVFPSRARNSLHRKRHFGRATLDGALRKAALLHQGEHAGRYRIQLSVAIGTAKNLKIFAA